MMEARESGLQLKGNFNWKRYLKIGNNLDLGLQFATNQLLYIIARSAGSRFATQIHTRMSPGPDSRIPSMV